MKVTKDTVTISELLLRTLLSDQKGQTVHLKDADPNELQLFIEKMPTSIKGKTKNMKCNFRYNNNNKQQILLKIGYITNYFTFPPANSL